MLEAKFFLIEMIKKDCMEIQMESLLALIFISLALVVLVKSTNRDFSSSKILFGHFFINPCTCFPCCW